LLYWFVKRPFLPLPLNRHVKNSTLQLFLLMF
jgi:hypothetical protein